WAERRTALPCQVVLTQRTEMPLTARFACCQRRHALRLVSMVATRCPELPPSPAPGGVDAPMGQSRSIGGAWRPDEANGLHSRLWSSSAEPPYGSPQTALGL